MTTSIASDGRWPAAVVEDAAGRQSGVSVQATAGGRISRWRTILGLLDNAVLLLLVVLLFPVVILLVGTPVALLVRLFIEIAERL